MDNIDAYSIKWAGATYILWIFGSIMNSDIALWISIAAGVTTIIRNYSGDSLKTIFWKLINKIKSWQQK